MFLCYAVCFFFLSVKMKLNSQQKDCIATDQWIPKYPTGSASRMIKFDFIYFDVCTRHWYCHPIITTYVYIGSIIVSFFVVQLFLLATIGQWRNIAVTIGNRIFSLCFGNFLRICPFRNRKQQYPYLSNRKKKQNKNNTPIHIIYLDSPRKLFIITQHVSSLEKKSLSHVLLLLQVCRSYIFIFDVSTFTKILYWTAERKF